jgi:hypothetical protein
MRQQHRLAAPARMSVTVGTIFSIRVASVTRPSSIGTLMSTRTSTTLPVQFHVVERLPGHLPPPLSVSAPSFHPIGEVNVPMGALPFPFRSHRH